MEWSLSLNLPYTHNPTCANGFLILLPCQPTIKQAFLWVVVTEMDLTTCIAQT